MKGDFRMRTVRDFAALIFVGMWLLVTLSACETSKHAEIMSTEPLRAQAQMATAPDTDTDTESDQSGIPFEGKPIPSAGLSEPLVFAPEPPPSPAPPPSVEEPAPPAPEPKPTPPAPEPKPTPPAPEPKPTPPAPEPKPTPPAPAPEPAPMSEETVPAEEPVAEPEMEVAQLEPSDFVPAAPAQEEKRDAPVMVKDSGLVDVFFDFDQYAIRPDAVPILEKNAGLLKSVHENSSVLIEGHCDERGTVEYNLELGKRRAQSVKDYLVDLGIEESRIRIASYGKEKPFCAESKPTCWQQNRRGHFVRQ
jgi:peptidoglycan-associated lipoprotein